MDGTANARANAHQRPAKLMDGMAERRQTCVSWNTGCYKGRGLCQAGEAEGEACWAGDELEAVGRSGERGGKAKSAATAKP